MANTPTKNSSNAEVEMNLDRVQMGDSALSCSEIAAQVCKLDAMLPNPRGSTDVTSMSTMDVATEAATKTTTQAASQAARQNAAVSQYLPYLDTAVQTVSQTLAKQRAIEKQRQLKAQNRKDYLVALYNERGCMRTVSKVRQDNIRGSSAPK